MTTYRDVVPTTYICHDDLKGRDHTLTVKAFSVETMYASNKAQSKPVLYFEEARKGLVVNTTINETLVDLYGPELENWIGKRIAVYPTMDDRGGKRRRVVRVRPTEPAAVSKEDKQQ